MLVTSENFYKEIVEKMPGLHIIQDDNIPLARGLGSSAACIVSGLLAANELSGSGFSWIMRFIEPDFVGAKKERID